MSENTCVQARSISDVPRRQVHEGADSPLWFHVPGETILFAAVNRFLAFTDPITAMDPPEDDEDW